MKATNNSIKIFIVVLALLIVSSCDKQFEYRNDYADLHAIAINSLIGVSTYESDQILILNSDQYGRKLYAFTGFTCNGNDDNGRIIAIIISQKTTNDESYFYDNVNFLCALAESGNQNIRLDDKQVKNNFTNKQIDELKETNDWDKPLNENLFFKVKIENYKHNTVPKEKLKQVFLTIATDSEYESSSIIKLTQDKKGNSIYYFGISHAGTKQGEYNIYKSYILMFDKNGNVDISKGIIKIKDIWNYNEQLKTFKNNNGWCSNYK